MNDCEIECLKTELEHEKNCRSSVLFYSAVPKVSPFADVPNKESAAWQNGELEKQIVLVQDELRKTDYTWDHDDDLMKESARHKVYQDTIETLREQLPALKDKIKKAKICGAGKFIYCWVYISEFSNYVSYKVCHRFNLKAELLRTVKRFERLKTDLISTLRSKEWRLDSESKLFVRVNDQRTYLQNELMICQNNIMRLQKNSSYWQNVARKNDERVLDAKRGPIKKIIGNERLAPIAT
ncbi:hypothetical protein HF086_012281 [Spodoptera exigua]|uniref:Uncharacterized protein n=1 Tax=Spodoptera exigua TaxID=7107 RepID=A0A922SER0_SPOEX|nr:hypothetical protein HF086_012281 [Spodoptera exigua]